MSNEEKGKTGKGALAGAAGGAVAGVLLAGGPIGALIGGFLGALLGDTVEEEEKKGRCILRKCATEEG